ncbi:hypothetical protein ACJX0J_036749, partial [Zea mays]
GKEEDRYCISICALEDYNLAPHLVCEEDAQQFWHLILTAMKKWRWFKNKLADDKYLRIKIIYLN